MSGRLRVGLARREAMTLIPMISSVLSSRRTARPGSRRGRILADSRQLRSRRRASPARRRAGGRPAHGAGRRGRAVADDRGYQGQARPDGRQHDPVADGARAARRSRAPAAAADAEPAGDGDAITLAADRAGPAGLQPVAALYAAARAAEPDPRSPTRPSRRRPSPNWSSRSSTSAIWAAFSPIIRRASSMAGSRAWRRSAC